MILLAYSVLLQRLTFMRTDTTVKTRPALTVHIGDASTMLGTLSYTLEEVNRALEKDGVYGVPLSGHTIRWFNRQG